MFKSKLCESFVSIQSRHLYVHKNNVKIVREGHLDALFSAHSLDDYGAFTL